jgi:hypothetical protein
MTPEQLAKGGTEHCHQVALMQQCQLMKHLYPELASPLLFAIPNGGSRGDTAQSARIQGGKLKAEGVKPGVSDLFLAVPRGGYAGFFLELKKERTAGVGPSEAQKKFIGIVQDQGYNAGVYYGWKDAWEALVYYMEMNK